MLRSKINSWFIRIQVNQNNGYQIMPFKKIILAFVYFWQVLFFWAVMLNITESNIKNISQTLSKSRQPFSKNSWAGNSCIFNSVLSNSILLWNSRKLRLRADAQPWIFQFNLHRTKKRVRREKLGDLFPIYFILLRQHLKWKIWSIGEYYHNTLLQSQNTFFHFGKRAGETSFLHLSLSDKI